MLNTPFMACSTAASAETFADDQKFELDATTGLPVAKKAADAGFHSGGDGGSGEGNSATRVGIKGSTDFGSGIKANFKFETGGIGSDGVVNKGGTFFNRQAYFGFSGGFGEVRLGRQDSVPFQTFIDYDFNGASNGVSAAGFSGAGLWASGRQSGSLQYFAPVMGGLKVQLGVQLKASVLADNDKITKGDEKDVISGGVTFASWSHFSVGGLPRPRPPKVTKTTSVWPEALTSVQPR